MSYDKLNDVFDIEPTLVQSSSKDESIQPVSEVLPPEKSSSTNNTILQKDFDFARETIRDAIQRASLAAIDAVTLAQSGDNPKAYEVVGNMLNSIVNANRELVKLHQALNDSQSTDRRSSSTEQRNGVTIEKAVFVGRAADLLREIRALEKKEKIVSDEKKSED